MRAAIVHWSFDPVLVSLGPVSVRWYGLLFVGAFFLGRFLLKRIFVQEGVTSIDVDSLLSASLAGTIVGARLMHCLVYDPAYFLAHPIEILQIWKGGLASHGGAIGLLVVLWLYTRSAQRQSFLWLADRVSIPAAAGAALVRVANFLNSEIIGTPTDGKWGVVFDAVDQLPRHPVQLYEAGAYGLIFAVLWALYRRLGGATPRGLLSGVFLMLTFAARFALEFLKTPQAEYEAGFTISVGQYLSVPFILLGLLLVIAAARASNLSLRCKGR
jgi:phosphatidylglycerol:prolipoprotein diacylglycerol transferase